MLGDVNKLFVFKSLLTMPSNVLPLHLKQIIWIFTEGEGDGIESRLPFKIFSTLSVLRFCLIFATSSFGKPCRIWFNSRTAQAILYQSNASYYLVFPKCIIIVLLRFRHIHYSAVLLTPTATGYKKKTGQFLRALHVYSIDNFVAFWLKWL